MIPYIGIEYLYTGSHPEFKGRTVHVMDTDFLAQSAKISIPDINGLCWNWTWTGFDKLTAETNP